MKILVTNDDSVSARGLWALVNELKTMAEVVVVAPDREMPAMGTSITLHRPLKARRVMPAIEGIETYAVEGTPADCVIMALRKLVTGRIDLAVSGINRGANLGDDILISGTVGAALQANLHGLPAVAVSVKIGENLYYEDAARFAALLIRRLGEGGQPKLCLNVNMPNLPREKISGVRLTYPAANSHTDGVEEKWDSGRHHYWLVRQKVNEPLDEGTDTWAVERGHISISALSPSRNGTTPSPLPEGLYTGLFQEFQKAD